MFTGIVKEIGTVKSVNRKTDLVQLAIDCPGIRQNIVEGDSIAIDGCDLTATKLTPSGFECDATLETLKVTTLGDLRTGAHVNLEPALTPQTSISGHFVLGHIDGIGTVREMKRRGEQAEIIIDVPRELMKFIARKGSITIAGVGLTVVSIGNTADNSFSCWIIPYTLEHTTLGGHQGRPGAKINIEVDVIARHVVRALESGIQTSNEGITEEFLHEHGFG